MKKIFALLVIFLVYTTFLVAQPVRLKLSRQINVPNYNHYGVSLTADGQTIFFTSDYYLSEGNKAELKECHSKGADNWGALEEVTMLNKSGSLNQYAGHGVSPDGNTLYFSSRKMGGVGGFDIWVSTRINGQWYTPRNIGKPVNSEGMEGFPSISPDGKMLYFVRCQTMTNQKAEGCKVYQAELKGNDIWKEPVALPDNVNQGNILAPKILKDGKTLLFSSDKPGGKGSYDLYVSKKTSSGWSDPRNISILNTSSDEIFADMSFQTDAIVYSSFVENYWTVFKAKLPEEFQPEPVVLLSGKAQDGTKRPLKGFVQAMDNKTGAPISITPISYDGNFSLLLGKDKSYDIAITAGNENFYWSGTVSAENLLKSKKEAVEATVEPLAMGKFYQGNKPLFDSTSYRLLPGANLECKRIAKLIQTHPSWKIELVLFVAGVAENKPTDENAAFETMKGTVENELSKAGIPSEKYSISNGAHTAEEEENYSGWGLKIAQ